MANKTKVESQIVTASSQEIKSYPIIAIGKRWQIRKFGAVDVNNGDNKSSVYILQWGKAGTWENIRVISLTGNTCELQDIGEFIGDGEKILRVIMQNKSAQDKDLVFWFDAYEG